MQKNWYRLDTAALIFPAITRHNWCNVFRVSATLSDPVDPTVLQHAADDLRARFPSFFVTLHRGAFWYYLEESRRRVTVREDFAYPLTFMSSKELRQNCLRILYFKNRIAVEFFHSLSDGRGGSVFLCNLVARYLELRYGITIPRDDMIRDLSETPPPEELECFTFRLSFFAAITAPAPRPRRGFSLRRRSSASQLRRLSRSSGSV